MKALLGSAAAGAVAVSGLALAASPAMAIDDGAISVNLATCTQATGNPQPSPSTQYPTCSYSFMPGVPPAFTYVTAPAPVTWASGTATGGNVSFPAASQTWPQLTNLYASTTSTMTPGNVTGTVDASGNMNLSMPFSIFLNSTINGQCTIAGTATLTSTGTMAQWVTNPKFSVPTGSAWNSTSQAFSVVSTNAAQNITFNGAGCNTLKALVPTVATNGVGWFLTGTMQAGDPPPPTPQKQTATVKTAKKIKKKGSTVLLKSAVTTNAGQKATSKVTWSTKKNAKGTSKKFAKVKTTSSGKVTITTTGKAKKLFVKMTLNAPANANFTAYNFSKTWTVK